METQKEKSNRTRTKATRAALTDAARALFADKGYAQTGTPEIATAAGVTRGALYHHFADKLELFRAVVLREAERVAEQISRESGASASPLDAILGGADAYFDAMSEPGRTRLLLIDGPAVLGLAAMDEIDRRTSQRELRQGLELAMESAGVEIPVEALTATLSAAFDRAALAVAQGESIDDYKAALRIVTGGIPGTTTARSRSGLVRDSEGPAE